MPACDQGSGSPRRRKGGTAFEALAAASRRLRPYSRVEAQLVLVPVSSQKDQPMRLRAHSLLPTAPIMPCFSNLGLAALLGDQAGWHLTPKLAIPNNITVLALPPRSPELNPVENVWQFMRDNWLSNRIFKSYEDIVALAAKPGTTHRPTMEDHVPRHAQMGAWVLTALAELYRD